MLDFKFVFVAIHRRAGLADIWLPYDVLLWITKAAEFFFFKKKTPSASTEELSKTCGILASATEHAISEIGQVDPENLFVHRHEVSVRCPEGVARERCQMHDWAAEESVGHPSA